MAYRVILKKNEEKRVLAGHSWVYANEVARVEGKDKNGSLAEVVAHDGRYIGKGYINHLSKILVRIFIRGQEEDGEELYRERIAAAGSLREKLFDPAQNNCYRLVFAEADDLPALIIDRYADLVFAEADDLPALIIDRYADYFVLECLSLGVDQRKKMIADALVKLFSLKGLYMRGDVAVRKKEGAAPRKRAPLRRDTRQDSRKRERFDHERGREKRAEDGLLPRPEGEPLCRAPLLPRGERVGLLLQQRRVFAERRDRCKGSDRLGHLPLRFGKRGGKRAAERVCEYKNGVRGRVRRAAPLPRRGQKVRLRHPRPARLLQERGGGEGRLPRV